MELNRLILCKILERFGFPSDTANNGQEAVDLVISRQQHGQPYKLIIMDVEMPVMNGWQASMILTEKQRLGELSENMKIIGHTAYST